MGICGTDLHAYGGNQAFLRIHGFLVMNWQEKLVEIGPNEEGLTTGDWVAIMPYVSCGTCIACRNGKSNCCTNIQVLGVHTDGGMQEYVAVRKDLLLPVKGLELDEIAIVEPLAIGAHAVRRAQIRPGETVLVIGCGPIGLGIMKLAQLEGARVIAMDINEERLQFAKANLGVEDTIHALQAPLDTLKTLTQDDLAQVVFDATGNAKVLMEGPTYMSHGGRYVLVGLSKGELTFHHPSIHAKETTLMCSRNATQEDFEHVITVLRKKQFPVDAYVTHRVGFEEMMDQFEGWLDPMTGVIKAMVNWD